MNIPIAPGVVDPLVACDVLQGVAVTERPRVRRVRRVAGWIVADH